MALTPGQQIGVNAASSAIGGVIGLAGAALQHKYNKELAEYQYDKNLEMWEKQNAYNAPSAQRARLEDAGLNPALMYGNGSVSTGNSSNMPQYQQMGVDISNNMLSAMQMAQMAANIRNIEADTQKKESETEGQNITNKTLGEYNQAVIDSYVSGSEKNRASVQEIFSNIRKNEINGQLMLKQIDDIQSQIDSRLVDNKFKSEQTKLTKLKQLTEIALRVQAEQETAESAARTKTEGYKQQNYSADTDKKIADTVNAYSQANLADSQSHKFNADTFYQECRNLYYREYGVFPDANADAFLMQLCTSNAEGLGTTKFAYFGDKALGHAEKILDIALKYSSSRKEGEENRKQRKEDAKAERELKRELAKAAVQAAKKGK